MQPIRTEELEGTWATVLTPFTADDRVNLEALDDQLDRIIAAGPEGLYTHGTAGEFFNQTEDEWDAVVTVVARRCEQAALPFQLGASHPSPVMARGRIAQARALNPAAIQVILPDWLPLSREEIVRVLREYARLADGVGLVLYNPPHAKNVLGTADLEWALDEVPQIVGVKLADGDAEWYRAMASVLERTSVFVPGHHLASGLIKGARGAYSNVACLSPGGAVQWARRSREDPEWGLAVERDIAAFMAEAIEPLIAKGYAGVTLDKAMAAAGGHLGDVRLVRWPHTTASDAEVAAIRASAVRLLPPLLHPVVA